MQNKKIYGVPISVARRIKQGIDTSNDIVIQLALTNMHIKIQQKELREEYNVNEDWHKHFTISGPYVKGCGCVYCNALVRYVMTKISAHRLRKRIDNLDWCMQSYDIPQGIEQLRLLEKEWPQLRAVKNQIKAELGM